MVERVDCSRRVKKDHEQMKFSFIIIKGAEEIICNLKEGSFSTKVTFVRRLKGLVKIIAVHIVHILTRYSLFNDFGKKLITGLIMDAL